MEENVKHLAAFALSSVKDPSFSYVVLSSLDKSLFGSSEIPSSLLKTVPSEAFPPPPLAFFGFFTLLHELLDGSSS